jgi:hypothetical protein
MSHSKMLITLAIALAAAAACNGFSVRGQQTPYGPGTSTPTLRPGVSIATAKAGTQGGEVRRVCRSSGMQSGWIAIDYVADSTGCGAIRGAHHAVALVTNYQALTVGSELEVCADQRTPAGWLFVSDVDPDGRCLDDANASNKVTVKRIRRGD